MFAEYREILILFFRTFKKGTLIWVVTSKWSWIVPEEVFFYNLQASTFYALNVNQWLGCSKLKRQYCLSLGHQWASNSVTVEFWRVDRATIAQSTFFLKSPLHKQSVNPCECIPNKMCYCMRLYSSFALSEWFSPKCIACIMARYNPKGEPSTIREILDS